MPLQQPYFVVLGNIEPRKNHWMLLQLWRRLVDQHAAAAPRLVIIGQRAWECENVVDLLERCRQLRAFVIERASCGDEELVNMLRHARALLYPSFVEGFGLPIAEALSLGVPVIASDLAVFREFAGEVPEYADPLDGRRWLELIADYAQPYSARRAAQTARMPNFSAPTWAHHFERVDHFVSDLHGH
jgi:glycosyltransferase involved in cell wall biosynthesis